MVFWVCFAAFTLVFAAMNCRWWQLFYLVMMLNLNKVTGSCCFRHGGGGGNFNCIHLISDLRKKHHKCWKYCSTIGLQFGCLCCFSTQSAFVHAGWPCKCLWIICVVFFSICVPVSQNQRWNMSKDYSTQNLLWKLKNSHVFSVILVYILIIGFFYSCDFFR